MTVLEELHQAEQRLIARVRELEPIVAEHAELVAELERRGLDASPAATATRRPRARRAATGAKRARRTNAPQSKAAQPSVTTAEQIAGVSEPAPAKHARASAKAKPAARAKHPGASRAPRGGRAEQIQNLVAQNPGLTVKDLGERLGVEANGLYQPVRKLVASGTLRKDGLQLHAV